MNISSARRWGAVAALLLAWAAAPPALAWSQGEGHAKPAAQTAKPAPAAHQEKAQAADAHTKPAADAHAKPAGAPAEDVAHAEAGAASAKEPASGKAARASAKNAEVSAREVVRRLETVMTEAAKPAKSADHEAEAATPHASPAGQPARQPVRRGATKPRPAPLLSWSGDLASGNVQLDWGTFAGGSTTKGVRLQWPAEEPSPGRK